MQKRHFYWPKQPKNWCSVPLLDSGRGAVSALPDRRDPEHRSDVAEVAKAWIRTPFVDHSLGNPMDFEGFIWIIYG